MKRASLLLMCLIGFISLSYAQTVTTVDNIRYEIDGDHALIGRQNKELSGDIVIPESISYNGKSYQVTGFVNPTNITAWSNNEVSTENGAFQSCPITSIVLPNTIDRIVAGAFYDCQNLKHITLPDSLKALSAGAFAGCTSLTEIYIPESVTDFGSYTQYGYKSFTFGDCSSLTHIAARVTSFDIKCFKSVL